MSDVKIAELADAPAEGQPKRIEFDHPFTEIHYELALYFAKDRYFVIRDDCKRCGSSLAQGKVNGMYGICARGDHPWNFKTGLYKFDRRLSLPTYRVIVRDDGLYIEI